MKSKKINWIKRKKVKLTEYWNSEEDILDFYWGKKKGVEHSRELNADIILDFDKNDNVVGIEIWNFGDAIKESQKKIDILFGKKRLKENKK